MSKNYSTAENSANQQNSNNTTPDHNNSGYKAAQDNRSQQCNPNNPKFGGGKSKGGNK